MPSFSGGTRSILQRLGALLSALRSRAPVHETAKNLRAMSPVVPEAIPALLAFLCDESPVVSRAAAEVIDASILACDPLELVRLDGTVRSMSEWRGPTLAARDVVPLSHGLVGVLGLLSFNANGYVRQPAVEALAQVTDTRELPFLLIRLNDWVGPVRGMARIAVFHRLRPQYADILVRCLPLVERLRRQRRGGHAVVAAVMIADILRSDGFRPSLRRGLSSPHRVTRRLAFELLTRFGDDAIEIMAEGLSSPDTVIRLRAARAVRRRLAGEELRAALERLKRDRFMPVRREALIGFAEQLPGAAPVELNAALLDPHAGMRETARFYLRQSGAGDFAAFYRERLGAADAPGLWIAVAGLGETGAASDAPDLVPFLAHREPRVRRAAVRAVGRLDGDANLDLLLAELQDPSPGVAGAARDAVAPRIHLVQPAWLETILEARAEPHVRRAALALAAELRWWDGAPLLIRAAGSEDESTRRLAHNHIRHWGRNEGRLSARPTRQEVARLDDAVTRHGDSLDPRVREDLLSLLAYAKRQA